MKRCLNKTKNDKKNTHTRTLIARVRENSLHDMHVCVCVLAHV